MALLRGGCGVHLHVSVRHVNAAAGSATKHDNGNDKDDKDGDGTDGDAKGGSKLGRAGGS